MIIPTIPVVFPVIISDEVNAVWNEKRLRMWQTKPDRIFYVLSSVVYVHFILATHPVFRENPEFLDFVCLSFYNSYIFMNSAVLFCFCLVSVAMHALVREKAEREGCCVNLDLVSETSFSLYKTLKGLLHYSPLQPQDIRAHMLTLNH